MSVQARPRSTQGQTRALCAGGRFTLGEARLDHRGCVGSSLSASSLQELGCFPLDMYDQASLGEFGLGALGSPPHPLKLDLVGISASIGAPWV